MSEDIQNSRYIQETTFNGTTYGSCWGDMNKGMPSLRDMLSPFFSACFVIVFMCLDVVFAFLFVEVD